jgi:heterodisulfide reductase subunit B
MSRKFDQDIDIPVAFFSQIMGQALGLDRKRLGLQRLFVPVETVFAPA